MKYFLKIMLPLILLSVYGCRHGDEIVVPEPLQEKLQEHLFNGAVPAELPVQVVNCSRVEIPQPGENSFLDNRCFVMRWNILGPLPFEPGVGSGVLHQAQMPEEKSLSGIEESGNPNASWELLRFNPTQAPGKAELRLLYNDNIRHAVAYSVTYLHCETGLNGVRLCVGSSDGIKIWLNRKLVHAYDRGPRRIELDQDVVRDLRLEPGYNLLVVKTVNSGSAEWEFFLRFSTADGSPLKFVPSP